MGITSNRSGFFQQPSHETYSGPNTRRHTFIKIPIPAGHVIFNYSKQLWLKKKEQIWASILCGKWRTRTVSLPWKTFKDLRSEPKLHKTLKIKKAKYSQTGRKKLSALKQQCPFKIYQDIDLRNKNQQGGWGGKWGVVPTDTLHFGVPSWQAAFG